MKIQDRSFVLVLVVASSPAAWSQTLGPDFANDYTLENLHSVPGVPPQYGGLQFKAGEPNTLLIVGEAEYLPAKIYEIGVTRDEQGHVDGFSGSATVFATTPWASAGLIYGPGGNLYYTTYPFNTLNQIKPGSSSADKVVDLGPLGVGSSTGGIAITPDGFPEAGSLKITSYNYDSWYDADLVPDGSGTYDVTNVALRFSYSGWTGPESMEYVDTHYPAFGAQSVLIMEWWDAVVSAYIVDWNGDPIESTRRVFLNCCDYYPLGSTIDQQTGDFLFADHDSGDQVLVVRRNAAELGTRYCSPGAPNSTGQAGVISAFGQPAVSNNYVTLTASRLPKNKLGYFLASQTQDYIANPGGSDGILCLGGAIHRSKNPVLFTGDERRFNLLIDLAALPVLAGETWNFQAWYRDKNPSMTSNFTDALSVTFQ